MSAISYIRKCISEQMDDMSLAFKLDLLTEIFILTEDMRHELCEEADEDRRANSKKKTRARTVSDILGGKGESEPLPSDIYRVREDAQSVVLDDDSDCPGPKNGFENIQGSNEERRP